MTYETFVIISKLLALAVVLWGILKLGPYPGIKLGLWVRLRVHHLGHTKERVRYFIAWTRRWWRTSGWQKFWSLG